MVQLFYRRGGGWWKPDEWARKMKRQKKREGVDRKRCWIFFILCLYICFNCICICGFWIIYKKHKASVGIDLSLFWSNNIYIYNNSRNYDTWHSIVWFVRPPYARGGSATCQSKIKICLFPIFSPSLSKTVSNSNHPFSYATRSSGFFRPFQFSLHPPSSLLLPWSMMPSILSPFLFFYPTKADQSIFKFWAKF